MKPVSDYPHFPDCPNVKTGVPRENYVEWRVNTQADGGGFINVCCEAEAQRLMRHARRWPNGSLRRTIERREVGPWMRMPTGGEVKRLTIEYSTDGGQTWHFGQTVSGKASESELRVFRTVVRYNQRRHGHGVRTRVVQS